MQYVEKEFQRRFAIINNGFFNSDLFKGEEQIQRGDDPGIRSRRIVGHLPEMPTFAFSSSWEEGTVGKILSIISTGINFFNRLTDIDPDALLRTSGLTQWRASSPLEVTLPLVFHRKQPIGDLRARGIDINENINKLVSLATPSTPSTSSSKVKKELAKRAFSAPAGFTLRGGNSFIQRAAALTQAVNPKTKGLSSIKIVQNGRLILSTDRFFACTSVNVEYSPQMDENDGFLWIKGAATFQTIAPITIDRFIRWFIRPRKIASFNTGQVDLDNI